MPKGMLKQFHKASQYVSEKIGNENDKTAMDEEFLEMERKVDITSKAIQDVMVLTKEYLQPNPATRAKLSMMSTYSKIQGKNADRKYPQPEGTLGEKMQKHGSELGSDSNFGYALGEVGDALMQMSEIKYSLDINVKQNFIDPLQKLCDKDIKEFQHHRNKLSGRRLDYDYKRKQAGKVAPDQLKQAQEKFEESLDIVHGSMFNLLSSDVEQVSQLATLVESQLEYHRQSTDILQSLHETLERKINEINSEPAKERCKRTLPSKSSVASQDHQESHSAPPLPSPRHSAPSPASRQKDTPKQPCCKALYDFKAENEGELSFNEGDKIILTSRIDENWFEGKCNGAEGFFPVNYVEVLIDLPSS